MTLNLKRCYCHSLHSENFSHDCLTFDLWSTCRQVTYVWGALEILGLLATVSPSSLSGVTMATSAFRAAWRNPSTHCNIQERV